jgi:hypothetical protein
VVNIGERAGWRASLLPEPRPDGQRQRGDHGAADGEWRLGIEAKQAFLFLVTVAARLGVLGRDRAT